ncbi:MAG: hypothetical protein A2015_11475 [Spirochaetes bacterium GWF1_31_7]|nr:MAG: hypothetical protein A2Y30_15600 [Spirochaetes bacterium GWE1_32_154]OHD49043.1 MAG: hypothetical protein A2015_11475 [Spirochaetes bacterium GWF1_31_7]OHD50373.1 MAG: hypothetical protein A2Y29_13650 [Spirochaetes bacterium GWE2_31_10]HBD93838.1 hypothetical protein [Spirochaetia bacterium]HBI38855.1 hypothetical protein [Spirochaetia bacterium]
MIKGVVESIDYKKNEVTIKRHGYDSCNNCKIGCASRPPESENIFKARLIPGLKTGDKITLDITPEKKIIASLLIFLTPVISLFAGFFIGNTIAHNELAGIAGAFITVTCTSLLLFLIYKKGLLNSLTGTISKDDY